jgi:hypothetical protein
MSELSQKVVVHASQLEKIVREADGFDLILCRWPVKWVENLKQMRLERLRNCVKPIA